MSNAILKIKSNNNPDWNGIWKKSDVEQEMKELDNAPKADDDWIYWVLEHAIDSKDFTIDMEKMIVDKHCNCIGFDLEDGDLTVKKILDILV